MNTLPYQILQNCVFNLTHDTARGVVEHLWSMKREFIGNAIKAKLFAEKGARRTILTDVRPPVKLRLQTWPFGQGG